MDSVVTAGNQFTIFLRMVFVVIYLSNSGPLRSTRTIQVTYDLQILTGYVTIWNFRVKRRKILFSLTKILYISPTWSAEGKVRDLPIKIALVLCTLVLILLTWTAAKFFYFGAFNSINARLNSNFVFQQDVHPYFTSVVIFSFILSYYVGTATLYEQILLCSLAYWNCCRLLKSYGDELQKLFETTPLSVYTLSRMLSKFRKVSSCIRNVDQALGDCPFLTYLYRLYDVFTVMGSLCSKDRKHASIEFNVFFVARALSTAAV